MPKITLSVSALTNNYNLLTGVANAPLFPVLKANAYGHGVAFALPPLLRAGATLFAVTSVNEALEIFEICKERITKPQVLIMDAVETEVLCSLAFLPVILSVHSPKYARALSHEIAVCKARLLLPEGYRLPVHLKLETGMRRLGLCTEDAVDAVVHLPHLCVLGGYSHLADPNDTARTEEQRKRFSQLCARLPTGAITHLSASDGILRYGKAEGNAVRAGLALYGVPPEGTALPLRPVMRFFAKVLCVFSVKKGSPVGGESIRAPRKMRLAVLDIGYTDGIPLSASLGGYLLLYGKKCPFFSTVFMDRCTIEVGTLPVKEGEELLLFGERTEDVRRFAAAVGSTPTALLSLRSPRSARVILP